MSDGIVALLRDDDHRVAMGEHGRSRVAAFSRETMLESLDALYEELARDDCR